MYVPTSLLHQRRAFLLLHLTAGQLILLLIEPPVTIYASLAHPAGAFYLVALISGAVAFGIPDRSVDTQRTRLQPLIVVLLGIAGLAVTPAENSSAWILRFVALLGATIVGATGVELAARRARRKDPYVRDRSSASSSERVRSASSPQQRRLPDPFGGRRNLGRSSGESTLHPIR